MAEIVPRRYPVLGNISGDRHTHRGTAARELWSQKKSY
jgi:hypothetical protein